MENSACVTVTWQHHRALNLRGTWCFCGDWSLLGARVFVSEASGMWLSLACDVWLSGLGWISLNKGWELRAVLSTSWAHSMTHLKVSRALRGPPLGSEAPVTPLESVKRRGLVSALPDGDGHLDFKQFCQLFLLLRGLSLWYLGGKWHHAVPIIQMKRLRLRGVRSLPRDWLLVSKSARYPTETQTLPSLTETL